MMTQVFCEYYYSIIRLQISLLTFLNLLSKMNKVFPIQQVQNDCSASSMRSNSFKIENNNLNHLQQKALRTCKICLEQEILPQNTNEQRDPDSQMICPCDCKGSLQYVHSKCLKIWLVKQMNSQITAKICCQLCQSQIFFKSELKPICKCTWHHLKEISKINLVSLIIQISSLILIAYLLWHWDQPNLNSNVKSVLLGFFTMISIIFLLTIFWTVKELFVAKIQKIDKIYSIEECEKIGFRHNKKRIVLAKQIRDSYCIRFKRTREKARNSLQLKHCNVGNNFKRSSVL